MLVAGIVGLHFKARFNRPRPVQLYPGLLPFLPTPAHASYPSNHATQAFTVAALLAQALDRENSGLKHYVDALAERIAVNREVAGLHYRSDTLAGQHIAGALAAQLATVPQVAAIRDAAREELAGFGLNGAPIDTRDILAGRWTIEGQDDAQD